MVSSSDFVGLGSMLCGMERYVVLVFVELLYVLVILWIKMVCGRNFCGKRSVRCYVVVSLLGLGCMW